MSVNKKSKYFWLSILFIVLFFAQLAISGMLVKSAIKANQAYTPYLNVAWLSMLWVSLAALCFYKATSFKQTPIKQFAVFFISPFALSPILAVIYVIFVLFPIYSLVNQSGFGK